jgi:competence protein ComEA
MWRASLTGGGKRRSISGMREITVPGELRARLVSLGGRRRETWLLLALVAAVVLGGVWLFGRAEPARVAPPAVAEAAPPPALASAAPTPPVTGSTSSGVVLVHVAGAVRRPGLYELPQGARVADALDAAGGPTRRARLDALNLAEAVSDGRKLEVPARGEAMVTSSAGAPLPVPTTSPVVVNINTADGPLLETIPGIGPVTAAAILEYRARIGSFTAIEQLLDVSGIGPATLESIRPYVAL